ncbi:uncharacterized protein MEPE_00028 [Melanopsichium pennsylvanicum]|uniref:Uncharacterized protein n=1 Tax=Melanopsichium pennsylvanicum TaxID=63383 RepID=A0AAJ4XHJ4_9BASI|nr:uncharacterized protein MEPE_00028 [Melanopsichium pennsylvanicum]
MSVSPFPPSAATSPPPRADMQETWYADAYHAAPSSVHHPLPPSNSENQQPQPFSSAAAYSRSPISSPPPRTATSPMTSNHVSYKRKPAVAPIRYPPPASSLIIQDPATSSSTSPAPAMTSTTHGDTTIDSRSKHSFHKHDRASMTKSARSTTTSWLYGSPDSFIRIPSRNALLYILVTTLEAIIVITLVGYIFGTIVAQVDNFTQNLKTVSVYLAVFVFGCVFQVFIAWDAVRLKNTMQLIGVLIFNIALTITAAIEIRQVRDALNAQDRIAGGIPCEDNPNQLCRARSLFPSVERFLIVVTAVCFVSEIAMVYLWLKLWKEFGWVIYQKIGADLKIRRLFFWYQLFIVFLKFTFFFGVGFTIIYLILVADTTDWEYGVTIAAVPIAVVSLFAAGFAVRKEWTSLMVLSLFLMVAGLTYFVYKVTQVWVPATRDEYTYVHTTITFISAFAILSLGLTWLNGIICLFNFHKGLKQAHDAIGTFGGVHRHRPRGETEANAVDLEPYSNVEPKLDEEYVASRHGRGMDVSRASAAMHNAVYQSNGGATSPVMVVDDPRRENVSNIHAYVANSPKNAVTLENTRIYATQPIIPAPLQPYSVDGGLLGAPFSQPAHHQQQQKQQGLYQTQSPPPQQQVFQPQPPQQPSQTWMEAHQPRPSASRIWLD